MQFLVDLFKAVVRHDHDESLQLRHTAASADGSSLADGFHSLATDFERAKRDLLDKGRLSTRLLRFLWAPLGLTVDPYATASPPAAAAAAAVGVVVGGGGGGPVHQASVFADLVDLLHRFEIAIVPEGYKHASGEAGWEGESGQGGELLVPAFFPRYLPATAWEGVGREEVVYSRWFQLHESPPAGVLRHWERFFFQRKFKFFFFRSRFNATSARDFVQPGGPTIPCSRGHRHILGSA